ncbi:hypothetical protein NP493_106g07051 [Ridgeia piscesae]|uniref:Uncharacterized protein n=1 Tax=Ridgeia piscesae TaxID=27915 RepID=A0AAD9P7A0_RIDPI|nr:hypothetical protein NP493_106g07051 [Ridgeia piscesae]
MVELRKQFRLERYDYVDDIMNYLGGSLNINVGQLRDAVQAADPEIGSDQLDDYVYWAFQMETGDEATNPIHVDELAERLRQGSLRRCGPQYGVLRRVPTSPTPTGLRS